MLESLAKVGALNTFGHPAQVLEGLDDAIAAGAATQRDLATGQTSLFDVGAADSMVMERPLPNVPEAPVRERLRWEKELLGLYLSEHPMGEVAEQVGDYVTAYSGDLRSDETLDGQRLVVGGIVVGSRTVITRTRSTMAVVTLEDLQGSIEVVVFPRLYEQTGPIWQEGAILLVAGRVDHRGEEVSLLADIVLPWEVAVAKGPEAFGREVAAGDRGGSRRRQQPVPMGPGVPPSPGSAIPGGPGAPGSPGGTIPVAAGGRGPGTNGSGNGHAANGHASNGNGQARVADPRAGAPGRRPEIEYTSPLRGGVMPAEGPWERPTAPVSTLPRIEPAEPVSTYAEPPGAQELGDHDTEPALPDEARSRVAAEAGAETAPLEAVVPGAVVHVRFGAAPAVRVVEACKVITQIVRERPGDTEVIVHVPAPGGRPQPMSLPKRVAYDSELIAEVRRRLGEGWIDVRLGESA